MEFVNDLNDGTDIMVIDQLGKQVNFEQNGDQIIVPHKGVYTILIKSEKGITPIKIIVQ